jgi:hypothetical protein
MQRGGRASRDERTTAHSQSQQPVVGATSTQHPSPTGLRDWANRIVVIRVYFSRSGRRDGPLAQVQHTRYSGRVSTPIPPLVDQDWRARFAHPFLSRDPSLIQARSLSSHPCEMFKNIRIRTPFAGTSSRTDGGWSRNSTPFYYYSPPEPHRKQLRLEKQSLDTGQCSSMSGSSLSSSIK